MPGLFSAPALSSLRSAATLSGGPPEYGRSCTSSSLEAFWVWASDLYVRSVYNRIEVTSDGIRQHRLSVDVLIPWAEVTRITEAPFPTAVLIHGQAGRIVRLDKNMIGLRIIFTYFREHLSAEVLQSAVNLLLPETALRMRVAAGRRSPAGFESTDDP